MIDTTTGFSTFSDSNTSTETSDISNNIFIGASVGSKQKTYIGQNVTIFNHQVKKLTTDKINTLELGPRLTYFFTEENVFYITLGWNPYAKGKRTVNGATEEISGHSFLAGLGAELKTTRNFYIGGSLNYHALNISNAINSSNVSSSVNNKYNAMMPMKD